MKKQKTTPTPENAIHIRLVYDRDIAYSSKFEGTDIADSNDWWHEHLLHEDKKSSAEKIPDKQSYRVYRTFVSHIINRLKQARENGHNICLHLFPEDSIIGMAPSTEERQLYSLFQTEDEWYELLIGMSKRKFFELSNNTTVPFTVYDDYDTEEINREDRKNYHNLHCTLIRLPEEEYHFYQIYETDYSSYSYKVARYDERFFDDYRDSKYSIKHIELQDRSIPRDRKPVETFHTFDEIYEILRTAKAENRNINVNLSIWKESRIFSEDGSYKWQLCKNSKTLNSLSQTEDDWFQLALGTTKEKFFKKYGKPDDEPDSNTYHK